MKTSAINYWEKMLRDIEGTPKMGTRKKGLSSTLGKRDVTALTAKDKAGILKAYKNLLVSEKKKQTNTGIASKYLIDLLR